MSQVSSSPAERHLYSRVIDNDRYLVLNGTRESVLRAAAPNTMIFYSLEMLYTWIGSEACHLVPVRKADPHRMLEPNYIVIRKGLGQLKAKINLL